MGSITRSFANNNTTAGKFDGTKLTGDIGEHLSEALGSI